MLVFEYRQKVKLKRTISYEFISEKIAYFIDSALAKEEKYLNLHNSRQYKNYVFDLLYPCETDKEYKSGKIYTFRIRTISQELAEYFSTVLNYHFSRELDGIGGELQIIQQKILDKIFCLTPVLLKNTEGYWRETMNVRQFEDRIFVNLVKKYNSVMNTKLDENIQLYDFIEFKNDKPVKVSYKGKILLGDKLQFIASKNKEAQNLWYMALGTGLGESNARGFGFMNYRYL